MKGNIFKKNLRIISGFNSFPDSWKPISVKTVFDIGRGRIISQDEINNYPGVYPVYSSQSFNNGEMGRIDTYDFNRELITWTTDGANAGTIFHRKGKFNCTNVCGTLAPKGEFDLNLSFFKYHLERISKKHVSYIGNPKLMNDVIGRIVLPVPKIESQQKIAKILNTVDAVIEKTEQAITKYQAIKKGMTHDLFTRGIDLKTGQLRPSYKDAPELYKKSTLGMIPKDWEYTKLGSKGSFRKGNNILKYNLSSTGKGCILYGQIYTHYDDLVETFDSKIPKELSIGMSVLKKGDILFAASGETHEDIGKCITYIGNDEVYPGGDIVILSLFKENQPIFFGYYLNHESIQKQKAKLGQGSSVIHIYKGHLEAIDISVPKPNEQNKISKKLIQIDLLIKNEQKNLSKHQNIKKGLMQDLLTAKVEVTV